MAISGRLQILDCNTHKQHLALLSKGINNSMTSLCNLKWPWSQHRKYQHVVNNLNLWLWAGCIDFFFYFFTVRGRYTNILLWQHIRAHCPFNIMSELGGQCLAVQSILTFTVCRHHVKSNMQIIHFERSEKSGGVVACIDFLYHLVYSFQGERRTHVSNGCRFFFVLSRWFWRK